MRVVARNFRHKGREFVGGAKKRTFVDIREYLRNQRHVPDFLQDFHDAKDFFKTLWEWQHKGEPIPEIAQHTWVSQHIFTMDVLLPFLAMCGYRLEKIRLPKMKFGDLSEAIRERRDRETQAFAAMLEGRAAPQESVEGGEKQQATGQS
jgi:hypothetical protein